MQKQLSLRDWFLFTLLGLTILLIVLAMIQIDRQWLKLSAMESAMSEQSKVMRELRTAIAAGTLSVTSTTTANTKSGDVAPAFKRALAASQLPDYAQGDWSVDAFSTNIKTITPLVSTDAYAAKVQSYVLESLITRDPYTL